MEATSGNRDDTHEVGTFLRGWGGVVAVLLGIAVALATWPLIRELLLLLGRGLMALGMTADGAVLTIYWLGMVAIGMGCVVAFVGSDVRMNRLRAGVGDWTVLLQEALIAAGVTALWVAAGLTWTLFGDEFNTYDAATELPALATLLLIIAGAVLARWARNRRRRSGGQRPS